MRRTVGAWVALVLQAVVLVFLYVPAGLIVPGLACVLLNLIGIGFAVACIALARRRSLWVVAVPLATALFWFAYVSVGEALFDWTA